MIKSLVKNIIGRPPFVQIARRLNRFDPVILMYHGLSNNPDTQDWTQVTVYDFQRQMTWLKENYRPVSLQTMVEQLETGKIEPHTAVVTFDDGYASNYDLAYPILRELDIPAAVFVTSGFVLQEVTPPRFLWPDFVTALIKSRPGPTFDLGDFNLGQYDLSSLRNIYNARNAICETLKKTASSRTEGIISALYDRYGEDIDFDRFGEYHPMNAAKIHQLAAQGLIEIGAHSRNHPILSQLDDDKLEDEIIGSKHDLEAITGKSVTAFAYPNGRWCDINRRVVEMTAGNFECAVTTETGRNRRGQNKYLLRRIGVGRNLGVSEFKALLSGVYYIGQDPTSEI